MRGYPGNRSVLVAIVGVIVASTMLVPAAHAATSSSTINSHICNADFIAPAITEPMNGYSSTLSSVTVKGTGEPGMTVTLRVNGVSKAVTTVAGDGAFAVQVPLVVGTNTLVAREKDECNNIKDSSGVVVERRQEPQPTPEPGGEGGSPSGGARSNRQGQARSGSPSVSDGSIGDEEKSPADEGDENEAPTINNLKEDQAVEGESIWVAGTAQPGSIIIIYVNGKEAARVVVGEDGTYGVEVALELGENTIKAVEERDGKRVASRTWHVTRLQKVARKESSDVSGILWVTVAAAGVLAVIAAVAAYALYKGKQKEKLS